MVKTQIQLPNPLYLDVKRIAKEQDWSLAEVLRRGAEYMARCYPERDTAGWQLPEGEDLGAVHLDPAGWREAIWERGSN